MSDKPQTTRRAIRGVANGPGWQLVLVDLPGVQRPRDALTERMQRRVEHELEDADGCLFVINARGGRWPRRPIHREAAGGGPGPGRDRGQQDRPRRPRRNRRGAAGRGRPRRRARTSSRCRRSRARASGPLVDHLVSLLPAGPFYFEPDQRSDQSQAVILAELVREQVLARTREEVPHSVEVAIESIEDAQSAQGHLIRIEAVILAETESQKRILIGAGGQMVKSIGVGVAARDRTRARDARAPRSEGSRPPALAGRRADARPARDRVRRKVVCCEIFR